jgi:hypothetical protein
MTSFEGFTPSDFDAFQEKKWSSNAFNRERLEVKLKLTSLGKELAAALAAKLPEQEMGVTAERPSIFNQHRVSDLTLYFCRNEAARRALGGILDRAKSIADNVQDPAYHHRHINLGMRVRQQGAEAGIWLHKNAWVDWRNVVQRCREYWERDSLADILKTLPESIVYTQGDGFLTGAKPVNQVDPAEILEGFEKADPFSFFGSAWMRDDPQSNSPGLLNQVSDLFEALVPLHLFISWRRDNDFHEIKEVIKEQEEKAKVKFSSVQVGDEVRVLKGLAAGRLGVVESIERKGMVKIRMGTIVVAVKVEELGKP